MPKKISERLAEALARFSTEEQKAEGGNAAAATRARKELMQIKQIASEGRKEILVMKQPKSAKAA